MAKAASPIRLQENLMQSAVLAGKRHHRSASEQIEYWAELGRSVAAELNPDVLMSVASGLARIKVEPIYGEPINPDEVLQALEIERQQGTLSQKVTGSVVKYQASRIHPGYLERIEMDGTITTGQFQNGSFITLADIKP
ncbi:MAG: hypothetical protein HOO93_12940 [Methyloglobulus sp.]|nr:hypothetical protein [Methyloglobulus sp.]